MITELIISIIVVALMIGGYYLITGTPPGAKLIVQDPPVTPSGVDETTAKFMFFYTTWCPHSRKAQTPWSSFKEMLKNSPKKYGKYSIMFEEINAESDEGKAALYQIKAYPTFKVETKDKVYEMLGAPSPATFRAFLISALGNESS
jgi:thiol-disulfide isomerase/thioredoxin